MIRGVRFSEVGGLLETLWKSEIVQTSNHPAHPAHPAQNGYNPYVATSPEVQSTLHSPCIPVQGNVTIGKGIIQKVRNSSGVVISAKFKYLSGCDDK